MASIGIDDLAREIAAKTNLSKKKCKEIIAAYQHLIRENILEWNTVRIEKLCTFELEAAEPRKYILNGDWCDRKKHRVKIKISRTFKDQIEEELD